MLSDTAQKPFKRRRLFTVKTMFIGLCIMLALATLTTWASTRTLIVDLGSDNQMRSSGVYREWSKGAVIVLIRHAERCDRSSNACLNDPSGITVAGSKAASNVGAGLQRLGLADAEVLSSPEIRTQQTAHFIFGKAIGSEDWVKACDQDFADSALAHKSPKHNLVLVTHSGCIDHVQRQLKVPGGLRSSEYASALFVSVSANGKAKILGQMNASEWKKLLNSTRT
ncbi:lipopolysaccharide core heptose(II)-phosphate phosphatase PmrG [Pseudomonas auratipiscis]|uniref:Histidine phosphatase family protein n=1 Tax=Pseudomonas auratipiscis TaxID=3115853 RepID=A0AB35X3M6_9PSED|nr:MULTISPECIES: histidine phosphatase family protein [unclassified Pseudomonas]MEE1869916.1 histidine phosphatase family protein [Pseudomonas sp. 120P]MEE1960969.1 histidine phosphatase family protein [Pseudomonas sp. 119P]